MNIDNVCGAYKVYEIFLFLHLLLSWSIMQKSRFDSTLTPSQSANVNNLWRNTDHKISGYFENSIFVSNK